MKFFILAVALMSSSVFAMGGKSYKNKTHEQVYNEISKGTKKSYKTLKKYLDKGMDANWRDESGANFLNDLATFSSRRREMNDWDEKVFRLLVERGADINNVRNSNPSIYSDSVPLIAATASSSSITMLETAVRSFRLVLELGGDINYMSRDPEYGALVSSPISAAVGTCNFLLIPFVRSLGVNFKARKDVCWEYESVKRSAANNSRNCSRTLRLLDQYGVDEAECRQIVREIRGF